MPGRDAASRPLARRVAGGLPEQNRAKECASNEPGEMNAFTEKPPMYPVESKLPERAWKALAGGYPASHG